MKRRAFLQSIGIGSAAASVGAVTAAATVVQAVQDEGNAKYAVEAGMLNKDGSRNWLQICQFDTRAEAQAIVDEMPEVWINGMSAPAHRVVKIALV